MSFPTIPGLLTVAGVLLGIGAVAGLILGAVIF